SDGKTPRKIAWLQCVGSRDTRQGNSYCSGVCCTYALKQMILVKSHHPEAEVTMFHNDIRTFGKGFEDFYLKAQSLDGARFIRKRISSVRENKTNNNLSLTWVSDEHTVREEEFDMVVLSTGISPGTGNTKLAAILGLELNDHGFCSTDGFSPNEVPQKPGIFPAACFISPMDIPDSISSASGAGAMASELLNSRRGTLSRSKMYPEEGSVTSEEPRIGVFVCNCGTNIGGTADVPALVDYAQTLENVVYSESHIISCSSDSLRKITEAVKSKNLNRVVVAACTPRDHEVVFKEALRDAGLNTYLLDMANIREHCTWVHSLEKHKATEKAKDTIAMSVARARHLQPLAEMQLPVNNKGLVLGGGLAGMNAALSLARQGFEAYLIEKEAQLGGNLRHIRHTLEGGDVPAYLRRLITDVENEPNITVYTGYEVKNFSGYIGNFATTIAPSGNNDGITFTLAHGITIVATGGTLYRPHEYHYGDHAGIITQQELESLTTDVTLPERVKSVVMIQCVGARNETHPYCSRICCSEAIKNALALKKLSPDIDVTVLYRDMRAYGFKEDYYREAREQGVLFIQYEPDRAPELDIRDGKLHLRYYDSTIDMLTAQNPDLVVLSTPVVPDGNKELSAKLRLPLT
ncbi:MAG: CoB--CoM heterodisulfide reductase iron-sulfur subunit A family protein, partial [Dehalococcoidales bacterium]|nr:CoB--CoM heterodisulfide reductase iron-sulfur subunit A family protein [Dehalococcoidales bacterium]